MPRARSTAPIAPPSLHQSLSDRTVPELKWYAGLLAGTVPTRKGELVAELLRMLTDPAEVRRLWGRLAPIQRQVVAEVVHNLDGRYVTAIVEAKYPGAAAPTTPPTSSYSYSFGGRSAKAREATPYDALFSYHYDLGLHISPELAALLRTLAPEPRPTQLESQDEPPSIAQVPGRAGSPPQVIVTETERAVFHDLAATLYLVQQGKITVGPATRLPTLASLRQLRERMLVGEYFAELEYERAEDAVRPLALIMVVQAAKWAAPAGSSGSKLELTRSGLALLPGPVPAERIREAWERWVKTDLLDELSRIRAIKGQQSKGIRLTKPAERREKLAAALPACPVDRWVGLDEFFRYLRAEGQSPVIERGESTESTRLHIGSSAEYGWLGYRGVSYWDVVVGSYLRAVLFEYAATLGLIDIAYTYPEETPHDFGEIYGMDEYEYLSRYDGLLGLRLTSLGAYVLGLKAEYSPPVTVVEPGPPVLRVLPNLDVVVTDASRITPTDRALLERIGVATSEDVYHLSRDELIEAVEHGLTMAQVREFLAGKSGLTEDGLAQTVRVFLTDVEQRLGKLRETGRAVVLEGDDPYVLIELSRSPSLRDLVRLAEVEGKPVLLVPEDQEAAVRRQLRKLGYVARKG